MNKKVIVVIGAGSIGQAIARRVGAGKHILLADINNENAEKAAATLSRAGLEVSTSFVDVSSRTSVLSLINVAEDFGDIIGLIQTAGVSPSQASPETPSKSSNIFFSSFIVYRK